MPIRLNSWKARDSDFKRIYVEGLQSSAKVWLQPARHGGVQVTPGSLEEREVRAAVQEAFGLDELEWDALWAIGQDRVPRGRPAAGSGYQPTVPNSVAAGGWSHADAEALDADAMAHPLPEPTTLLVDHREPAELKDRLRAVRNLVVEEVSLEVGDYVVPDLLTIERKTVRDLVLSVSEDDKRLFKQTNAMALQAGSGVLLLEGDIYGQRAMSLPSITGTLSYLSVIQGVSIVPTMSLPHSAYMIVKLLRHRVHGLGYDLGLRGAAPKDPAKAPGFLLEGLPGVSANIATRLLAHFGSARAVANASESELLEVPGIGPGKAKAIADVFGHAAERRTVPAAPAKSRGRSKAPAA
jgi:Fanconi anemia group M protein